ncbi:MAG: carbohydrate ABC transporter permease [Planctomycetota bacterium]|nr:carbohydrate ABC transporter permease [Planctomycetota bacterium]
MPPYPGIVPLFPCPGGLTGPPPDRPTAPPLYFSGTTIYILRSFFARIPREMLAAARIDGCGEWGIFWRVMFPIATPAIGTIMVINFAQLRNEFLFASVLIQQEAKKTLPLMVLKFVGDVYEDIGRMAAGTLIAIVPVIVIYMLFSEKFIKGMTQGSARG